MFRTFALILLIRTVHSQSDQVLPRALLSYQTCKLDGDCKVENSYCDGSTESNNGLCKCEEGFIIIRQRKSYDCVKRAETIHSACTYNEQCELSLGNHGECDDRKQCDCKHQSHFVKRRNSCYSTSKLNETCKSDENCVPNYPDDDIFCTYGRCTCGLKRAPNDNGRCVVIRRLGELCETDDSCLGMNAVCRVVCTCRVGYVLETEEKYCLKAAEKLYDPCTQNSQCAQFFQHSECVRGRCQCKTQYHQYGNDCYSPSKIGSFCKHKGECITNPGLEGRVDCINSICLCVNGLDSLSCEDISGTNRLKDFQWLQIVALLFSLFLLI